MKCQKLFAWDVAGVLYDSRYLIITLYPVVGCEKAEDDELKKLLKDAPFEVSDVVEWDIKKDEPWINIIFSEVVFYGSMDCAYYDNKKEEFCPNKNFLKTDVNKSFTDVVIKRMFDKENIKNIQTNQIVCLSSIIDIVFAGECKIFEAQKRRAPMKKDIDNFMRETSLPLNFFDL